MVNLFLTVEGCQVRCSSCSGRLLVFASRKFLILSLTDMLTVILMECENLSRLLPIFLRREGR